MNLAPASLLAQVQTTAGPVLAYSATHQTEITRAMVTNSGANDKYTIYHADSGAFTDGCALYIANVISANSTITVWQGSDGEGVSVKAGGKIGFANSATGALTLHLYGITRAGR